MLELSRLWARCWLQVGSASSCLRRVALEERLHGDDMTPAALLGTLLHMLFQVSTSRGTHTPAAGGL